MRLQVTTILAAATVAVAACGGSGHPTHARVQTAATAQPADPGPGSETVASVPQKIASSGARAGDARSGTATASTHSAGTRATSSSSSGSRHPVSTGDPNSNKAQRAKGLRTSDQFKPHACLKFAGLGHIRSLAAGKWQGTTGENPTSDLKGSVFVAGPYPSTGAAASAIHLLGASEIAFQGGRYVVTATKASYLSETVSLAAACLSAGSSHSFSF